MMEIRAFQTEDAQPLSRLVRDWDMPEEFDAAAVRRSAESLLKVAGTAILVAMEGSRCIGYAQTMHCRELLMDPWVEVTQLLVAKDWRGKGIGHSLMSAVETAAQAAGVGEIRLSSQLFRSRTHVFYESLGYECTKMSKFYRKTLSTPV